MIVWSLASGLRRVNPSADLDEGTLQEIARMTGGRYFRARDTVSLQEIYRLLDNIEPVAENEAGFRPIKSFFYWPLGAALITSFFLALICLIENNGLHRLREDLNL